jgi:hypothetical protein
MNNNFTRDPNTGGLINNNIPSIDLELRVQKLEQELREVQSLLTEMRRQYGISNRGIETIRHIQHGDG